MGGEISFFKTIRINFHYFPFFKAIHFPIIVSRNVKFDKLGGVCEIRNPSFACVRLGFKSLNFFDNSSSKSIWHNAGKIFFWGKATLGNGFKISVNRNGYLQIGNNFHLSGESTIISNFHIEIGNDCLFSWDILIMDTDFHKIYNLNSDNLLNFDRAIHIGSFCWIGCRTLILKGSRLPDWSIVAAGTIVSKELQQSYSIYGGANCISLKSHVKWDY